MKENINIDELLNSYIDDELPQRHQTEVKRLVRNDPEAAKRLEELRRHKMLLGSLPCESAPAGMLDEIKSSLERKTLLGVQPEIENQRVGQMHLLFRKVVSAAAMIVLAGGLAMVVYTIVVPDGGIKSLLMPDNTIMEKLVSSEQVIESGAEEHVSPVMMEIEKPAASASEIFAAEFKGRLELKTNNPIAVASVIKRAIEDNGLLEYGGLGRRQNENIYKLRCSRKGAGLLLADLEKIWGRFDSTTLFVETGAQTEAVAVNEVEASQVVEIIEQDSSEMYVEVAKGFAVLNDMIKSSPGREVLAAVDHEKHGLATIPKPIPMPVLTSGEKTVTNPGQPDDEQNVNLTIVIVDTN